MAGGTVNDSVVNSVDGRPATDTELSGALKTLRDGMLTNTWTCPQAGGAGGLTSRSRVGVTPDSVASGADVTAVNTKFCTLSDCAPWLWVVLALFVPCEDVQSVASSNPRICAGLDRALEMVAKSPAGAASSGATLHAARPNARGVSAPKSATVVVCIFRRIRMMSLSPLLRRADLGPGIVDACVEPRRKRAWVRAPLRVVVDGRNPGRSPSIARSP